MIQKFKLVALIAATYTFASCNSDSSNTTESNKDTANSQASNSLKDTTNKMPTTNMPDNLMTSMNSMMDRMKEMKMTGDFDIDFATMMIGHHQGAIDMSEQEVSSGKDDKVKGMAQKIIVSQKDEIAKLQDFVKTYKPSGMKHGEGDLNKSMSDMESKMKNIQMTNDMDKDFAAMMVVHQEGAVEMSKKESTNGMSSKLKQMAQKGQSEQTREIKEFKDWLQSKK